MELLLLQAAGAAAATSAPLLLGSRLDSPLLFCFPILPALSLSQGYIKMSRKNNNCGVASQPTYVVLN